MATRRMWNPNHLATVVPDKRWPLAACRLQRRINLTADPRAVECMGCDSIVMRLRDSMEALGTGLAREQR